MGLAQNAVAQQPTGGNSDLAMGFSASGPRVRPNATKPDTAKYEETGSSRSFVLQRQGDDALVKFDDSPEVMALRGNTAQRGDAFLKSDSGRLVMRVTEQGNVISYASNANGAPADVFADASPLDAPAMPASLTDKVEEAAEQISLVTGGDVTIFGASQFVNEQHWAAEALTVLVIGVERAVQMSDGAVDTLEAVRMDRARLPVVTFDQRELVLGINPGLGYRGRPSSEAIALELTQR